MLQHPKATRTIHIKRQRTAGLGFSVKGGREHGIPVVVCEVDLKGPANTHLNLGDEVLSVNGKSLIGLAHSEAVEVLRRSGQSVSLCIRPNQNYRDVFTEPGFHRQPPSFLSCEGSEDKVLEPFADKPLPQGWSRKIDNRSGRPYYENHWTQTTTWTDPRSLRPLSCKYHDWTKLPVGWERIITEQGEIYYVNHDMQSSSWDHPRGLRQMKQLEVLKEAIEVLNQQTKDAESEIAQKRQSVLEKNEVITPASSTAVQQQMTAVEDIMMLNEEVGYLESTLKKLKKRNVSLLEITKKAVFEDVGELNEFECAANLSAQVLSEISACHALEGEVHQCVQEINHNTPLPNSTGTPISYLMQMPPLREKKEIDRGTKYIHLLPDHLTSKTNCEMRLECLLLGRKKKELSTLCQSLVSLSQQRTQTILEDLTNLNVSCLQSGDLLSQEFR
uniref:KIBRA-like protein n=1 Tax=Halisarca dujardinii TaxID=2583056 RepID=A0AA49X8T2_HALDU|nr:KIBRA-like protein [Halisarca dujardinii]